MPRWMPSLAQPCLLCAQLGVAHALHQCLDAALVRQVLDLDAAGGDGGIGIVGEDVAAAHLDGVDAERRRGAVDQMLADRVADRVADGAVLRGRRLVEIDHRRARPVVLVPVGPARDVEHLGGLEHAGARVLRVGARRLTARRCRRPGSRPTCSRRCAPFTKFSRAWMSETNDSSRSAMNLTGRPSWIAAAAAATSSP